MTTRTLDKYERYRTDFQAFTKFVDGPSWLHKLRDRGFAAFDRNGLPTQMRGTEKKEEMFHGGMGEDVFTGMMDEEMSKRMAGRGAAGIADMLFRQLSRQYGIGDAENAEGPGKKMPLDVTQSAGALMRQLQGVNASMNATRAASLSPEF